MSTIAIVGAGLSGLVAARQLAVANEVTLFEKSRGVGGRMATRYADGYEFDHGAQFFVAKTPAFRSFLQALIEQGAVASWSARFAELEQNKVVTTRDWGADKPHYVGAPRMNAVGKALAKGLDVRLQTRVAGIERRGSDWLLLNSDGRELGLFDWVIFTAPAGQTRSLLPADSPLAAHCDAARIHACFALMLGFNKPAVLPWQAALIRGANISWVSVNSSKPGRAGPFSLVVHSSNDWADRHLDESPDIVRSNLLEETARIIGIDASTVASIGLQRWRYANADPNRGPAYGLDAGMHLAACGDWFVRGRVEAAFTSAQALVNALGEHL